MSVLDALRAFFGFLGRLIAGIFRWVGDHADEPWFWYAVLAGIIGFVLFRLWQSPTVKMVTLFVTGVIVALLATGVWRP